MLTHRFLQTDHLLIQWPRRYHPRWLVGIDRWSWRFNGVSCWLPVAALRAVVAALGWRLGQ